MYYDRKSGNSSKTLKSQGSSSTQQMLSSPMKHEYPSYFGAESTSYQLNKLPRLQNDHETNGSGELMQTQSQNYPSYRKKTMQYQQTVGAHSPSHQMANLRGANGEFNGREPNNRNSWLNTSPNARHGRQQVTENNMPQNYNSYADEEPVYEEILSRTNENCDGGDLNEYSHKSEHLLQNIRVAHPNNSHKIDTTVAQQQQSLHSR